VVEGVVGLGARDLLQQARLAGYLRWISQGPNIDMSMISQQQRTS